MVTIKRYGNRRLYDTHASKYVNLEDLTTAIRAGTEVRVVDAATGEDLTREVLLQIVLEVLRGGEVLPTGMLRRIIRASGDDPLQRMLRDQIGTSMSVLSAQLDQLEAMFGAIPKPPRPPNPDPSPDDIEPEEAPAGPQGDAELDELRERLARLEERLKPKAAPKPAPKRKAER